jgi:hypothetical protein
LQRPLLDDALRIVAKGEKGTRRDRLIILDDELASQCRAARALIDMDQSV